MVSSSGTYLTLKCQLFQLRERMFISYQQPRYVFGVMQFLNRLVFLTICVVFWGQQSVSVLALMFSMFSDQQLRRIQFKFDGLLQLCSIHFDAC